MEPRHKKEQEKTIYSNKNVFKQQENKTFYHKKRKEKTII
jgi:hypothetical protein